MEKSTQIETHDLLEMPYDQLVGYVSKLGQKPFRANQIFTAIHKQGQTNLAELSTLSKDFRNALCEDAFISKLVIDKILESKDGTRKYRFETHDGHYIESVFIPNASRPGKHAICISSQIGCAMGCRFCATAAMKLKRNLSPSEIAAQVYMVTADLRREKTEYAKETRVIHNIVYMGMGEPLHNFDNVKRSIEILQEEKGLGYSGRRITVSTSGVVKNIERLGVETDVHLAVSLNATQNSTRTQIMPVNKKWPIEDLLRALTTFPLKKRERITFEYVLLEGINDTPEDAMRLTGLMGGFACKINLIPFNEHPLSPYKKPSKGVVEAFKAVLVNRGLSVFVRSTRGDDVDAACGMLGAKKLQEARNPVKS